MNLQASSGIHPLKFDEWRSRHPKITIITIPKQSMYGKIWLFLMVKFVCLGLWRQENFFISPPFSFLHYTESVYNTYPNPSIQKPSISHGNSPLSTGRLSSPHLSSCLVSKPSIESRQVELKSVDFCDRKSDGAKLQLQTHTWNSKQPGFF